MTVVWSGCLSLVPYKLWQVFVLPMVLPTAACEDNYPTIVEVYESLFWLQISVHASWLLFFYLYIIIIIDITRQAPSIATAKAMEGISHSFSHGDKYYGT